VLDAVVRLNQNVSRSDRRFAVDVECEFFVDTFDLCVQKTQGLIVFNSRRNHEHPVNCVLLHNAEYIVDVLNPYFREDLQY
jgi:hypothetical protein